jgi:hypothetical protein
MSITSYIHKNSFHDFEDYLMTKTDLRVRYSLNWKPDLIKIIGRKM